MPLTNFSAPLCCEKKNPAQGKLPPSPCLFNGHSLILSRIVQEINSAKISMQCDGKWGNFSQQWTAGPRRSFCWCRQQRLWRVPWVLQTRQNHRKAYCWWNYSVSGEGFIWSAKHAKMQEIAPFYALCAKIFRGSIPAGGAPPHTHTKRRCARSACLR